MSDRLACGRPSFLKKRGKKLLIVWSLTVAHSEAPDEEKFFASFFKKEGGPRPSGAAQREDRTILSSKADTDGLRPARFFEKRGKKLLIVWSLTVARSEAPDE